MKKHLLMIILLATSSRADAAVFGGSNLGLSGYPDHSCIQPVKPIKPAMFFGDLDVDLYNSAVRRYNSDLLFYQRCLEEYLDNAVNDIARIKEKMTDAVESTESH